MENLYHSQTRIPLQFRYEFFRSRGVEDHQLLEFLVIADIDGEELHPDPMVIGADEPAFNGNLPFCWGRGEDEFEKATIASWSVGQGFASDVGSAEAHIFRAALVAFDLAKDQCGREMNRDPGVLAFFHAQNGYSFPLALVNLLSTRPHRITKVISYTDTGSIFLTTVAVSASCLRRDMPKRPALSGSVLSQLVSSMCR
jgi:hypothetical protein